MKYTRKIGKEVIEVEAFKFGRDEIPDWFADLKISGYTIIYDTLASEEAGRDVPACATPVCCDSRHPVVYPGTG